MKKALPSAALFFRLQLETDSTMLRDSYTLYYKEALLWDALPAQQLAPTSHE